MKRLPFFSIVSLCLAALFFIITCKKEFSYEGGSQAEYTFVGAPDTCMDARISGEYNIGVPADSLNNVLVYIVVTSSGSAQITTEEEDGISFSTGKLALTEDSLNHGIIFLCHGTPTAAGTFIFDISGTPGCSFTITVTPPAPAGYTLSGAPNDCGNPVEQGTYSEGVAMTNSNVVTINVEVAAKGPYTMTTDKVNGISFSGSGTFSSTGAQQVILQATGTPDIAELTHLILSADDSKCSFYVSVANAEPVATYVLQSAAANGIEYCSPGSVQGNYTSGTNLKAGNTLTVNAYVTVVGNYTISTTELNGMTFSASGTFTDIGAQDVVLQGNGTPEVAGNYTFYPQIVGPAPIGGSICGLDVLVK